MKKMTILLFLLLLNTVLYAQEMEMIDTDGTSYKVHAQDDQFEIQGMKDKVVFLEFFGLKCPACKDIMPNLIKIQEKYPHKLKILAVEVQNNDVEPIKEYKAKHGINYTTFSNYDIGLVVRYIANNSEWNGAIPLLLVIDTKGKIQVMKRGVTSEEQLQEYVDKYSK